MSNKPPDDDSWRSVPPPPRPPHMPPEPDVSTRDPRIPEGSADYSAALADSAAYKRGDITFEELQRRVLARALPPHHLGDAYLMMTPPPPPPGMLSSFNPLRMPGDWRGTWGEVAMTLFAGDITHAEYERLHAAAHPDCRR
ncbi:hypothetical protein [Myxococcus faecalis]|uniref:hypothetical protein n=1 Tax=Myxococcus faecalis TaxID=3115646 RepID=UPI003CF79FEF